MPNLAIIFALLGIATLLAAVTDRIKIPYPIFLVLVGLALGFIPNLPHIRLEPDIVFLVFLPPILYSAAWYTSWRDFKRNLRPITLLATGAVLLTVVAVAVTAHALIDGLSWAAAFTLGAIVSPPDAVAATAVISKLPVPKRIVTILEGESLINDSTGLIAYRFALGALTYGTFSLAEAGLQFLIVAVGGILLGLLLGYGYVLLDRYLNHASIETSLSIIFPFGVYQLCESVHLSGVLGVVSAGLYVTWQAPTLLSARTRLAAIAVWDVLIFMLNGLIFILIGLQLPDILQALNDDGIGLGQALLIGASVSLAVMVIRFIWVFPAAYLPRWISKKIRTHDPIISWKFPALISWAGMRGVVTLAAALALPLTLPDGSLFPHRDLIIFISFCVILSTLVLQGLTLPFLIQAFRFAPDTTHELEESDARMKAAEHILTHVENLLSSGEINTAVADRLRVRHSENIARLTSSPYIPKQTNEPAPVSFNKVQCSIIRRERDFIVKLRNDGLINDETLNKLFYEIDIEEARLVIVEK
jgi:monovalent cation/hydrogen antiporter